MSTPTLEATTGAATVLVRPQDPRLARKWDEHEAGWEVDMSGDTETVCIVVGAFAPDSQLPLLARRFGVALQMLRAFRDLALQ